MFESSDRMVAELEKIREGLYREQPMTMDAVEAIINLLQYLLCPHKWETKRIGGDPTSIDSTEPTTVCAKCGAEQLED